MPNEKTELVIYKTKDEFTKQAVYEASINVRFAVFDYETDIPYKYIASYLTDVLRRYAINIDYAYVIPMIRHANDHPVCPVCHREIERGE